VAGGIIVLIFIEFEGITLLLDCIVCQMHEQVIDVLWIRAWGFISLSCKSSQAFLIDKDSERFYTIDQSVHSQIKLETIDEVWIIKVGLRNILISLFELNIFKLSHQEDTATLTQMDWLHNKDLVLALFTLVGPSSTLRNGKLIPKFVHFPWQDPRLGKKAVLLFKNLLHPHQVSAEVILPRELIHPWKMIYSLICLQLGKLIR
jgi:hypothetical protein